MTDVALVIGIGTFLLLMLASFVTFAFYIYQKRQHKHLKEVTKLKTSYQQEILKSQLEMQEQTFRTISQEIHDNIGQILALTRLNISTINPEDLAATDRKINNSKELLDRAIDDLRDLSKRLNPEFVSQQSLSESLKFQLNLIQKTGVHATHLEMHGEEKPLDAEKKLIVFRIAQEALNNIIKHARAKSISVILIYLPNKTILSIRDDGSGFEVPNLSEQGTSLKGIGTHNMYYRANLIGAQFSIQSQPGEGTVAQLILPVTP